MSNSASWFKLYSAKLLNDDATASLSPEAFGAWVRVICYMHENGRAELIKKPKYWGRIFGCAQGGVSPESIIDELIDCGTGDIQKDADGSIIMRSNRMESVLEEQRSKYEKGKERKEKWLKTKENEENTFGTRSEHSSDVFGSTSTSTSTSIKKKRKVKKSEVENLYQTYPRKVGKRAAIVAITKAIERITDRVEDPVEWMDERVALFARSPVGQGSFCPHPSTWFNQDRFDDDVGEWQKTEKKERPKWGETDKVAKSRSCCVCGGKATHSYQTKNYCEQHDQYSKNNGHKFSKSANGHLLD